MRCGRVLALVIALASSTGSLPAAQRGPATFDVEVSASPIKRFRIGSHETLFGRFEFVGGLELRSADRRFGSISGFRFRDTNGSFVAVTDTGYWMYGRVRHDAEGRPESFTDISMQGIEDADGLADDRKWTRDAESLELSGKTAIVGFERDHRIATFDLGPISASPETGRLDFLVPPHELRRNAGFEAVARAPAESHLAGAIIAITERSLDTEGNLFAAVLSGPETGIFKVARQGGFDVTDGVFLPGGDLLLVERSFSLAQGVRMRLRKIELPEIRRGRTVGGEVLFAADMRHQIDNMEAIDAWLDGDGRLRLSILSDDNQSILQRNLYLEFRLADGDTQAGSTGRSMEKTIP